MSEHSSRVDHATNNEMELMAIREAVSRAPLDADLEILTDSRNAVGWLAERWKRNKPQLAALCREIEALAARRSGKITYKHVRGHRCDTLNERADRLATARYSDVLRASRRIRGVAIGRVPQLDGRPVPDKQVECVRVAIRN